MRTGCATCASSSGGGNVIDFEVYDELVESVRVVSSLRNLTRKTTKVIVGCSFCAQTR